jgi:hypothetical protein
MRKSFELKRTWRLYTTRLLTGFGFWLILALTACSLIPVSQEQSLKATQLKETQLEVNTRQTLIAQQASDKQANSTLEVLWRQQGDSTSARLRR